MYSSFSSAYDTSSWQNTELKTPSEITQECSFISAVVWDCVQWWRWPSGCHRPLLLHRTLSPSHLFFMKAKFQIDRCDAACRDWWTKEHSFSKRGGEVIRYTNPSCSFHPWAIMMKQRMFKRQRVVIFYTGFRLSPHSHCLHVHSPMVSHQW